MYHDSSTGTVACSPGASVNVVDSAPSTVCPQSGTEGSGNEPFADAGPLTAPSAAKSDSSDASVSHVAVPTAPGRSSDSAIDPLQRSATGATAPSVQPVIDRCAPRASLEMLLTFAPYPGFVRPFG